jgi:hypothetical protein
LITAVPVFDIDLDLPPEERFVEVARYYKDYLLAAAHPDNTDLAAVFKDKNVKEWVAAAEPLIDADYKAEVQGMAREVGYSRGSPEEKALIYGNILYEKGDPSSGIPKLAKISGRKQREAEHSTDEAAKHCSGVLWAQKNGTVLHGRNMDYTHPFRMPDGRMADLNNVTHDLIFYKNKKPLFRSTSWPAYVGVHTGMRFGGYTFEQNTRLCPPGSPNASCNKPELNLQAAKQGGLFFGFFARKLMETVPDYRTAVDTAWNAKLIAPMYMVFTGPGSYEGSVLTIDRMGAHTSFSPPLTQLNRSEKVWHLVQTNDDLNYDTIDPRRPLANALLRGVTQDIVNETNLASFLHTPFLLASETVFSNVMCVKTGLYKTFLVDEPPGVRESIHMTEIGAGRLKPNGSRFATVKRRKLLLKAVGKIINDTASGKYTDWHKGKTKEDVNKLRHMLTRKKDERLERIDTAKAYAESKDGVNNKKLKDLMTSPSMQESACNEICLASFWIIFAFYVGIRAEWH